MPDIEITPLPIIRPFIVPLPDGTVRRDSIVYQDDNEFRQDSQAEFAEKAAAKTADYLAAKESIQDAQAVRDVEELIIQIEQIPDLSASDWVEQAFAEESQTLYLMRLLLADERLPIARPMIEQATPPAVPRTETVYGPLWQRWLTMIP